MHVAWNNLNLQSCQRIFLSKVLNELETSELVGRRFHAWKMLWNRWNFGGFVKPCEMGDFQENFVKNEWNRHFRRWNFTQRPSSPTNNGPWPVAGLPLSNSFFRGVSHTGFRTGYNSSHPGENEVNSSSSHKLQMKSYNLCSLWIITFEAKIKILN